MERGSRARPCWTRARVWRNGYAAVRAHAQTPALTAARGADVVHRLPLSLVHEAVTESAALAELSEPLQALVVAYFPQALAPVLLVDEPAEWPHGVAAPVARAHSSWQPAVDVAAWHAWLARVAVPRSPADSVGAKCTDDGRAWSRWMREAAWDCAVVTANALRDPVYVGAGVY